MIKFFKSLMIAFLPSILWIILAFPLNIGHNMTVFGALIIFPISCGIAILLSGNKYFMITFLPSILWVLGLMASIAILPGTNMNILLIGAVVIIFPISGLIALALWWIKKRKST